MASIQGGSVVKSVSFVELSAAEQAAARKALAGLGSDQLLTGHGSESFGAGEIAPGSFVASFASDTVSGGNIFVMSAAASVPMSADPFGLQGPNVGGMVTDNTTEGQGQVVSMGDQTTINLIGVNNTGSTTH
jgi:hypothetical protein